MAFTGWKGSDLGIDFTLRRARPALLMFLDRLLSFFPFSSSGQFEQSSIAFAVKVSGLHDM